MSNFQTEFRQLHFDIFGLVLPMCSVCTPRKGVDGVWNTPLTCDESSDGEYTLWFATNETPLTNQPYPSLNQPSLLNSKIFKCVASVSERFPDIKMGDGLASRGTISLTFEDMKGTDPGPLNFTKSGTFFGKLDARNILEGKKIVRYSYAWVGFEGEERLEEVSRATYYIEKAYHNQNRFMITGVDALKNIEAKSKKFPNVTESTLTADINDSTTTLPVTNGSLYAGAKVLRIDDELLVVDSVNGNTITVKTRGATINGVNGQLISKTVKSEHSADSTVQICYVMDDKPLADVLYDAANNAGLSQFITLADWQDEINEFVPQAKLNGVQSKPEASDKFINARLKEYRIAMWFDQPTQKIVVSATSAFKGDQRILREGADLQNLSFTKNDSDRISRVDGFCRKEYQAQQDDEIFYSRHEELTDVEKESSDFYGSVQSHRLGFMPFISIASLQTTEARLLQAFGNTPKKLSFTMEERKLVGLGLGSVIEVQSRNTQTPSGELLVSKDRAQITSIQPNYTVGRNYKVSALAYLPEAATGDVVINQNQNNINLFSLAGSPNVPVDITFVFDGCTIGSDFHDTAAIRAGAFQQGSKITIILINDSFLSSIGGKSASVSSYANLGNTQFDPIIHTETITSSPIDGGVVYQSDGVETEIYINYGNVGQYASSGRIFAPGGAGSSIASNFQVTSGSSFFPLASASLSGGGGSGVGTGKSGAASAQIQDVSPWPEKAFAKKGGDGSSSPGTAASFNYTVTSPDGRYQTSMSGNSSAGGGYGEDGTDTSQITAGTTLTGFSKKSQPSLAGGAIRGSNVTLYNLASQQNNFISGRSDQFTLIEA